MQALIAKRFGMPPEMAVEERSVPTSRPGFTLVRMRAATINQLSNTVRTGGFDVAKAPLVLGNEGAGTVEAGGRFPTGTRVAIYGAGQLGVMQDGLQQEWVLVEDKRLFALPDALGFDEGAAITVNFITAHQALRRIAEVQAGQTVLVSGATGALGHALMQMTKALGARPIALVSTAEKARHARKAGAEIAIDLSAADADDLIGKATGGRGADLAMDPVGGPMPGRLLRAIRPGGTVVAIGFAGGLQAQVDLIDIIVHEKRLLGYDLHLETDDAVAQALAVIGTLAAQRLLKPIIDRVYDLADVEDGYRRLGSREAIGAVVLRL